MTTNLATWDRVLRAIIGLVLVAVPILADLALFDSSVATGISVIVGLVLLGTAAVGFCPAYRLFGIGSDRA